MGQGQTPFKIGMEYLISGILVLSAFLLYRNRDAFDPQVMMLLYLSIAATILSELAFTTYFNTYGFTNFLGHILKILAFLCIYLAVIDTGFSRPFALIFRDLSQSREELRDLNSRLESKVEERTMELRQSNENLRASCEQLSAAEEKLRVQNSELSRRDDAVQAINRDLEKRVEERTSELQHVNEELRNSQEGLHRQIDALAARDRLLAESEERFRISAYSVSDVIWDWKIPPGTLDWYGDIDEMLGYAPGEFPRTPVAWENIIHPDDQLRVMEILHRHVTAGTPYATEYRVVRKDGAIRTWTDRGNVMRDMDGTAYRMVGSCNDITDYRMAEETLRASEVRYRRLFEAAQDGILILDAVTGQIVDVNPFLISMLGFSHEQFQGKKIWDIGVFKDLIANKDNFEELQRKEYIRYENLPLETADGRNIAVEFVSNVYRVNDRKVIQCNIRDITERRKLADQIEASLAEKETLLKEIHHRVKNNLQIITSMLNLQIRKINDPATIETLKDSQSRVRSMALVHEHLYRSEDLSRIDLRNYIRALGTGLFQSYEAANRGIRLDLNVQDVHVDINTAIPLGLISNELITNALKYAFEGKKDGRISIYAADESGGLRFVVADNGTGMPETVTFENQASLGLRLVSLLTEQLKGTVAIDRMDGTTFTIQIPRDAGPDKPGVNP
jgi:PAS domain S-box-containing protein